MRERPLTEFISEKGTQEKKKPEKPKGLKGPWELPEGWRWVRLGDVVEVKGGKRLPKGKRFSNVPTPYPYLRVDSFENYTINSKKVKFISKELHKALKRYIITSKDVYISIAGSIGIVGMVPPELDGAHLTENAARLVIINPNELHNRYLMWFLASPKGQEQINKNTIGIGQPKLALKRIKTFWIPLPPLSEQKRIVAKLDELNKRIEEAKRLAREAREEAERLMASALHEVFSKAEEKDWEWMRLGDLVEVHDKYRIPVKKSERKSGPYPYCGANGIIDYVDGYTHDGIFLMVAEDGGFFGQYENSAYIMTGKFWANNHVHVLKVKDSVKIEFLMHYLNYADLRPYTTGSTRPKLSQRALVRISIPLPPLEEQKRIVAYLDSIHERAQKLVKLYEEREKELEKLFPAVLDRAFRGEV